MRAMLCCATLLLSGCLAGAAPVATPAAPSPVTSVTPSAPARLSPVADHHKHLVSPAAAALHSDTALTAVQLPAELAQLLKERERRWNDSTLAELYTGKSLVLESDRPQWLTGRREGGEYLNGLFARAHRVTPLSWSMSGNTAYIAGYYSRDIETGVRHFGHVLLGLRRESDGRWRIAAELPAFPGVVVMQPTDAAKLLAELDAAGTRRAAVLSVAYWFGSDSRRTPLSDEYAKVRAENAWVAAQVALHPDRLTGFCSFNPLKDYALQELERCAQDGLTGLKLHFGNSAVDLRRSDHAAAVAAVFRAANARRMPIIAHLWTAPEYEKEGAAHAQVFLSQLLPAAPDVLVQVAHAAGGGRSTEPALAVFADAIAAGDPRTAKLYFDIATLTEGQTDEGLERDAVRFRQVGMHRILWGSDQGPPSARDSWLRFRTRMPLSEEELRVIATNVAPYMK